MINMLNMLSHADAHATAQITLTQPLPGISGADPTLRQRLSKWLCELSPGFGSRSRRFERDKIVSSPSTCES